jgi:DNA repair exonuclease SbcCD ATPase subunit
MANQAQGDDNAIGDQIRKLDMSIKKQEQELIDIIKKSKEKKEEVETVEEALNPGYSSKPERMAVLNDRISKLQGNLSKLDMSKPENKTKEAILKSDLTTAKLRLQDLMQNKITDRKKESVNEANKAKQSYKTLKMSLKKEQETDNKKKTLTDKPLTKIEVNPKIEG